MVYPRNVTRFIFNGENLIAFISISGARQNVCFHYFYSPLYWRKCTVKQGNKKSSLEKKKIFFIHRLNENTN